VAMCSISRSPALHVYRTLKLSPSTARNALKPAPRRHTVLYHDQVSSSEFSMAGAIMLASGSPSTSGSSTHLAGSTLHTLTVANTSLEHSHGGTDNQGRRLLWHSPHIRCPTATRSYDARASGDRQARMSLRIRGRM
jgi:hypothetical protein